MAVPVSIKGACCCRRVAIGEHPLKRDLWWFTAGQGWMLLVQFFECWLCVAMGMLNAYICHGEYIFHSLVFGVTMDKFVKKERDCQQPCAVAFLGGVNAVYSLVSFIGVVFLLCSTSVSERYTSPVRWQPPDARRLQASRPLIVGVQSLGGADCDGCMKLKSCCQHWERCGRDAISFEDLSASEAYAYGHLQPFEGECKKAPDFCWRQESDWFGKLAPGLGTARLGPCASRRRMGEFLAMRLWLALAAGGWCLLHGRIALACYRVRRQIRDVDLFATDADVSKFSPPKAKVADAAVPAAKLGAAPRDQVAALEAELAASRAELGKVKADLAKAQAELGNCRGELKGMRFEKDLRPASEEVFAAIQGMLDRCPSGLGQPALRLTRAFLVEVPASSQDYVKKRQALGAKRATPLETYGGGAVMTAAEAHKVAGAEPLQAGANEVFLWQGAEKEAALARCREGFGLETPGAYGKGAYFSESAARADEGAGSKRPCLLLCRVALGEILKLTAEGQGTAVVVEAALKSGAYHSVLGQQESNTGTFREFVVYDRAQARAEYVLEYDRVFSN